LGSANQTPIRFEIDAHALAVYERRCKGLLDNEPKGILAVAAAIGMEVSDVLGRAERRPGLLEQKDREIAVGGQVSGANPETVKANFAPW
jgi:hypothetical protein